MMGSTSHRFKLSVRRRGAKEVSSFLPRRWWCPPVAVFVNLDLPYNGAGDDEHDEGDSGTYHHAVVDM